MFKNPRLLWLPGSHAGLKTGLRFLPWVGWKRGEEDDTCQTPWVPVRSLISKGWSCAVPQG